MQKVSMHEWIEVASKLCNLRYDFRGRTMRGSRLKEQGLSNARAVPAHDTRASKESLTSMNPAQKALWYIESHLGVPLTLDEIAAVGGISRFHMVRAFADATGISVMRYVRARRLTEAARALANGAPDILNLALDADYGSHEAFTRAFRDHFGVTPETVRATTCLEKLKLQEPIMMNSTALDHLKPPRVVTGKAFLVAGIGERYNPADAGWRPFPASGSAFIKRSETFPIASGRSPMASAATATIPAISTISPASRSPTSPTCRASSPASASPNRSISCSPTTSTSRPSAAPSARSGIMSAAVRHEGRRRAEFRAL